MSQEPVPRLSRRARRRRRNDSGRRGLSWLLPHLLTTGNLANLTTMSIPALKEFLDGETAYRSADFEAARAAFERAIAHDSSFALAFYQLSNTWGWTNGPGHPGAGVPQHSLLAHPAAGLDDVDLPLDLVLQRPLDVAERVDVLQLGACSQLLLPPWANRHVGVAAQRALLHVAGARADVAQDAAHPLQEQIALLGAA